MDEKFLIKTVPNCKNIFGSEIDQGPYIHYITLVNGCCSSILSILCLRVKVNQFKSCHFECLLLEICYSNLKHCGGHWWSTIVLFWTACLLIIIQMRIMSKICFYSAKPLHNLIGHKLIIHIGYWQLIRPPPPVPMINIHGCNSHPKYNLVE